MSYFFKENKELENQINKYFEKLSDYNRRCADGKLSVILLGSLSRGEGTWIETENGCRLLSDIEYFTVFSEDFCDFDEFNDFCKTAQKEVFGDDTSTLFHIDNSFIRRKKLPFVERKLLTYDAVRSGKNIVGEDAIGLLPEITIDNINLIDIKDILTHRIFSVLYYGFPLKNNGNLEEYRYSLAKNSLDLMTVVLVSNRLIESGFEKRFELIKKLPIDDNIKKYFSYCLSVKLSCDSCFEYTVEEMEEMFISLVKQLYKDFSIPLKNVIINRRFVIRRLLGIIKRSLKYRRFPHLNHLNDLIKSFERGDALNNKQIKNNLVINGYPVV